MIKELPYELMFKKYDVPACLLLVQINILSNKKTKSFDVLSKPPKN